MVAVFDSLFICIFIKENYWLVLPFVLLAVAILEGINVVSKVAMKFKTDFLG